ncbi:hypothetical protein OIU91_40865 (plasmid) [Streptomyces sp. NBC_01456]|uniref:hypothetical protein n=1 Tax=unclassified Streptomyces TaxID=2593676 RepID=UPI002E300375|nr:MULTISPECIES: hypothetical protein [unclassified Streptomyces]
MTTATTTPGRRTDDRVLALVTRAAALADVRAEVEANHDHNRWWPPTIADPRMRMLAAGWSTRISYRMVDTYAAVLAKAEAIGFDALIDLDDAQLRDLVTPLGLTEARLAYLYSLADTLARWDKDGTDPAGWDAKTFTATFAREVRGASYKVAQCAALYARGYHCGIIPVDSGMVTKLAPALGFTLPSGPAAHEHLRRLLEHAVTRHTEVLRTLADAQNVTIPAGSAPTWWTHLTLIYFKRLYLNRPPAHLCPRRPTCSALTDCAHTRT